MFDMDGPSGWTGGDGFIENQLTLLYYYWSVISYNEFYDRHLPKVPHAQNYYGFLGPRIIDTADRAWLIRSQILQDIFVKPAFVDRILLKAFTRRGLRCRNTGVGRHRFERYSRFFRHSSTISAGSGRLFIR